MSEEPEYGEAEYLCYEVVRQMENRGAEVPETAFNKLCSLVYEEVKDNGVEEVDLPIQWYMYGNVVNRNYLIDDFLIEESGRWGNHGTQVRVEDLSQRDFNISDKVQETIHSAASRFADMFQDSYGTVQIKDHSYEKQAPNDFIRVMNDFRAELEKLDAPDAAARDEYVPGVDVSVGDLFDGEIKTDVDAPDVDDEALREYLRQLVNAFPEDTYSEMSGEFYRWQTTCRNLIRYNLYGELREFQEEFWRAFSRSELRIKHNENVPPGQIHRWSQSRAEQINKFNERLEAKQEVIRNHRKGESGIDEYAKEYDSAVQSIYERLTTK
jgi:hypothetical protein